MSQEKIIVRSSIVGDKTKVWNCYTQPEHITQWNFADPSWHCPTASNDLKVGGKYIARMEARDGSEGFDFEVVYTEVEPEQKLTYEFWGRFATVEFVERNTETEVIITFDPENENPIELQKAGWQSILNNFKKYVEEI